MLASGVAGEDEMARFLKVFAVCAAFLALFTAAETSWAEDSASEVHFSFNGVKLNSALLGGLPLPTGADIGLEIPLGDTLSASVRAAGGFEDRMILRSDSDGSPAAKPDAFDGALWFHWPNAQVDAGLVFRPAAEGGAFSPALFSSLRARYEKNLTSLSTTFFSDAKGLTALSFIAGAGVDTVEKDIRRSKSGYAAEVSGEYAPAALGFSGKTDFFRISASAEAYLPLSSWGADDLSAVSLYAAGYATVDAAWGSSIPLYVLTSFGGRDLRSGLGSSVRGYRGWGYEAATKAAASLELRLAGPGLFGQAGVRPLAYLFGDSGAFDRLVRAPGADSGLIASAGAGAALDLFDFVYLGARAGLRLPFDDPLQSVYFPGGETFFWNITFLLHF